MEVGEHDSKEGQGIKKSDYQYKMQQNTHSEVAQTPHIQIS